ncbi:hypothetical protein [Edwardsiella tarda]|uniref:hypothetical protein n=1 Tax=Edwardsiella tarda TaxID=636 RepID=UPI0005513F6D|nr:hypothetical protein [Edwardsiella tarda]
MTNNVDYSLYLPRQVRGLKAADLEGAVLGTISGLVAQSLDGTITLKISDYSKFRDMDYLRMEPVLDLYERCLMRVKDGHGQLLNHIHFNDDYPRPYKCEWIGEQFHPVAGEPA